MSCFFFFVCFFLLPSPPPPQGCEHCEERERDVKIPARTQHSGDELGGGDLNSSSPGMRKQWLSEKQERRQKIEGSFICDHLCANNY